MFAMLYCVTNPQLKIKTLCDVCNVSHVPFPRPAHSLHTVSIYPRGD